MEVFIYPLQRLFFCAIKNWSCAWVSYDYLLWDCAICKDGMRCHNVRKGLTAMKFSEDQLEAIKKYYPSSNYEELYKWFPGYTKAQIIGIANSHGVKKTNPGPRKDLTGMHFGKLTAIEIDHISEKHALYWRCGCSCGNECVVLSASLLNGNTKSCGCLKHEVAEKYRSVDHSGERFGKLIAVKRLPKYNGTKRTYYRCLCDCGGEKIVLSDNLVSGSTKSCGCLQRKPSIIFAPTKDYLLD